MTVKEQGRVLLQDEITRAFEAWDSPVSEKVPLPVEDKELLFSQAGDFEADALILQSLDAIIASDVRELFTRYQLHCNDKSQSRSGFSFEPFSKGVMFCCSGLDEVDHVDGVLHHNSDVFFEADHRNGLLYLNGSQSTLVSSSVSTVRKSEFQIRSKLLSRA